MSRVSVIIPTYNRKDYVQEAIDSVLAQTYTDYEIIVIDDGSTDGTGEALQARYGDRIHYEWQENQGESVARNRGIELALGEYIAPLDSDDVWSPNRLAVQVPMLDSNPHVVLVFGKIKHIDHTGEILSDQGAPQAVEENLSLQALCLDDSVMVSVPITSLIRREILQRINGYNETIQLGEDYDLLLRLRLQGEFLFIPEVLGFRRLHPKAQHMDRRLSMLEKRLSSMEATFQAIFDIWPGGISDELRQKVLGNLHGRIGIMFYAYDDPARGRDRVDCAISLYPERWANVDLLTTQVVDAILFEALMHNVEVSRVVERVRTTLDFLPSDTLLSKKQKRHLIGQVYAAWGFEAYKRDNPLQARYCFSRAIRYDLTWLCNVGVLSIITEAFLGRRIADKLRGLGKRVIMRGG